MSEMTPREIVQELDKYIVGQQDAKRAVAIALRNRWRRSQVAADLREEITPKNILMIGPTGVGKTEIARRLAHLAQAPFIKVEATKFTEVGYVGRDVESIIRDLVDVAINITRAAETGRVRQRAEEMAEERVLDILLPGPRDSVLQREDDATRQKFRKMLREAQLDSKDIEIELQAPKIGVEIMAPPGMEEMTGQLQEMFSNMSGPRRSKTRKVSVKEALRLLADEEASKLVNDEEIKAQALERVQSSGIVFIDEIDKVASRSGDSRGPDVSREGVQRDLLPLVEGCTVTTKHGMVKTDHILFIASGAFHTAKPSDLIPELQGRLPIRVELKSLDVEDLVRILTEPESALTRQYQALLATEGVTLEFTPDGIRQAAEIAQLVNERLENIGARRLHTVMERLLESLSFDAPDRNGVHITIDSAYVQAQLGDLVQDQDWSRYIL